MKKFRASKIDEVINAFNNLTPSFPPHFISFAHFHQNGFPMKIIQANLNHLHGVVELFDAYRVWYRKKSDKKKAEQFLKKRLTQGDSVIYACENKEGQLIGFTQLYPIFSSVRMKKMWLLNDLFVQAEWRGKGISKKLLDQAKNLTQATDACGILLETEKNNEIGNQLYPKMGFELEANNFYFWAVEK